MNPKACDNQRLFAIWNAMKHRCYASNSKTFKHYGARGIKVCDDWKNSFESFYNWSIENGYADNLTIDRIDNDGNYEPSNCRWATYKEQANNTRNCHFVTIDGITKTITGWCENFGVSKSVAFSRLRKGWDIEAVFKTPVKRKKKNYSDKMFAYEGKSLTLDEWSKVVGIEASILKKRVRYGWGIKKILTTPASDLSFI